MHSGGVQLFAQRSQPAQSVFFGSRARACQHPRGAKGRVASQRLAPPGTPRAHAPTHQCAKDPLRRAVGAPRRAARGTAWESGGARKPTNSRCCARAAPAAPFCGGGRGRKGRTAPLPHTFHTPHTHTQATHARFATRAQQRARRTSLPAAAARALHRTAPPREATGVCGRARRAAAPSRARGGWVGGWVGGGERVGRACWRRGGLLRAVASIAAPPRDMVTFDMPRARSASQTAT